MGRIRCVFPVLRIHRFQFLIESSPSLRKRGGIFLNPSLNLLSGGPFSKEKMSVTFAALGYFNK